MTPSIDQILHQFATLLPNLTLLPILTLLPNFGGFHRILQRVRLANRGRLLLRTPGPFPFGTCICSNVDTILSWTCHVYGPSIFLKSPNFSLITNIKSFDFSTLYTTIPHHKLNSRLATIIRNSFLHKNGNRRYQYLVLGREGPYFVKENSDSKNNYTEEDIIKMLEFLVDNIFVVFAGKVFQQIIGIPMGTNCAPLLADIFLYLHEAEFIQSLLTAGKKLLASQFNFTYRYIDDVLFFNNPENYLGQMYPPELES